MMPVRWGAVTKFFKRSWIFFAVLIIIAAIFSSLFRAVTPLVTQYKTLVEEKLSAAVGKPVTIGSMETDWYWFEPVIKLKKVTVLTGNSQPIQVDKLLAGIDLFSSLLHWQIQPGVLYAEGVQLSIQQTSDGWQIEGLEGLGNNLKTLDVMTSTQVLAWILAQQKIIIKDVTSTIHLKDNTQLPVKLIDLSLLQRSGHYHVTGNAWLQQKKPTFFHILANAVVDPYALKQSHGQLYVSASQLQLAQWHQFYPETQVMIEDGLGDIQLWLDWREGAINNAQSRISFHQLNLKDTATEKNRVVNFLNANLAWVQSDKEWTLSADHLRFNLDNTLWPDNKLMVRYQRDSDTFYVYVKHLVLESLIPVIPDLPVNFKQLVAMMPHGKLEDTQCQIKDGKANYLLTSFSGLGWHALDSIPRVDNLTGVLHWQPSEGMLELGGENTIVESKNKPPVTFKEFNVLLAWKELSHGMRVSLERFVINHPELLVSASGAVDDVMPDSAGQVNLVAQVSASNVQKWLSYLPSSYLKEQVDSWLKQSIKKVDNFVAEVTVDGLAADFPFDAGAGVFKIDGHVRGMDFVFAPGWPLTKDFEAFFQVDKRNLNIDVVTAKLQDIAVTKANVQINNIGMGNEALLLHTVIDAEAKHAMAWLISSPLNAKLKALNRLQVDGDFNLDLHLEFPLNPNKSDVLTTGDVTLNNNRLKLSRTIGNLQFEAMNGSVRFNQYGLMDSSLHASLLGYPVEVLIQSVKKPNPGTLVSTKLTTSAEVLRQKFDVPIFLLMQGEFELESVLTITENPDDLDRVTIKSSLQGVAIQLPAPFAKTAKQSAPVTFDIDFNVEKTLRIRMNYDNRISGDLWFSWPSGKFLLEKGQIRLGSGGALWQSKPGLQVTGTLSVFDLSVWCALMARFPDTSILYLFTDAVQQVDVLLKKATLANREYTDMAIKAARLSKNDWSVQFNQKDLAAQLRYQSDINKVSGTFSKLHLYKGPDISGAASKSVLKPEDMPTLELQIKGFQIDALQPGDVSLKLSSHKEVWELDYCKIDTPYYQVTAKGQWTSNGKENRTSIQARMQMTDLAKSLQRWNVSPVVHSDKGTIQFEGAWPGAFFDFSLATVSGQLNIRFTNGRITDLSSETEEKLGLGKLLSILSLQTIPRRLKLDFSDLSHKGYSFDEFKGSFNVDKGLMHTKDSFINGPIAYASMNGSLDIARQFYDLELRVTPYVTASLPIVATIAGGPVAGIATWVVSKIINKGMQKVTGYTYKITGPWKHPVVQQISIIKQTKH